MYTVEEVAVKLRCSASNVYSLIERGDLTYVSVGTSRGYRITEDDLQAFIESRKQHGAVKPQRATRPRLKHLRS